MEPKEKEIDKLITMQVFNDTDDSRDDERQYFTIEKKDDNQIPIGLKDLYENAGVFSTIFFRWVSPVINVSRRY